MISILESLQGGSAHGSFCPEDVLTAISSSPATALGTRPQNPWPGVTVGICTYRRAGSLRRFLASLAAQDPPADQLLVVDASPDDETEQMVQKDEAFPLLAGQVAYFRVTGSLRGLARQRNFCLAWAARDLLAFFDDDTVLQPGCLHEMAGALRRDNRLVGVGAYIDNEHTRVDLFWRLRRWLLIAPHLQPGKYCRSGVAIPWRFLPPTDRLVEGDWLLCGAAMWRTQLVRELGFNSDFYGYSSGEDLEFSLRASRRGQLGVHGRARLLHLHDANGRPDPYELGKMSLRNAHTIHRNCLAGRTWRDAAWFLYAYGMDTLLRSAALARPGKTAAKVRFLQGRMQFFLDLARGRIASRPGMVLGRAADRR